MQKLLKNLVEYKDIQMRTMKGIKKSSKLNQRMMEKSLEKVLDEYSKKDSFDLIAMIEYLVYR